MFKDDGFSLIELLVVIAIIGILAAVAVPAYVQYEYRAKIAAVVASLNELSEQLMVYYDQHNYWPATFNGWAIDSNGAYSAVPNVQSYFYGYAPTGNMAGFIGFQLSNSIINSLGLTGGTSNGWIFTAFTNTTGVWVTTCGNWGSYYFFGTPSQIAAYLPASCTNQAVYTTVSGF